MGDSLKSQTVSTKLQRIAKQAVNEPDLVFKTLGYLINVEFLKEAYRRTRKDAAPGIDGVTAKEYAKNLDENLQTLYERMKSGRYKAPPVKRKWIDKEDGSQRPIGIPVFEDKIVQRAVTMMLGAIYEQEFYDSSHGFREGRSPHSALSRLRRKCTETNISWVVDADVSGLFDNIDHGLLRKFIKKRVNDGTILRFIGKWLNAGVLEGETLHRPVKGTPQGGVISPMLSNIFLHNVLDEWFECEVKPGLKGRSFLIRFADDFVIGCELEEDARWVMAALIRRFEHFKLTIHPQKTTLVKFRKPPREGQAKGNGTFDFLGFTHYWAKSRQGYWVIKRKTARKRLRRAMKAIWQWCRYNRHKKLLEQYRILSLKLRGYYQYYGIRGNYKALEVVYEHTERVWRYWLSRRSHKGKITWEKLEHLRDIVPLPKPRIVHNI